MFTLCKHTTQPLPMWVGIGQFLPCHYHRSALPLPAPHPSTHPDGWLAVWMGGIITTWWTSLCPAKSRPELTPMIYYYTWLLSAAGNNWWPKAPIHSLTLLFPFSQSGCHLENFKESHLLAITKETLEIEIKSHLPHLCGCHKYSVTLWWVY